MRKDGKCTADSTLCGDMRVSAPILGFGSQRPADVCYVIFQQLQAPVTRLSSSSKSLSVASDGGGVGLEL